MIITLLTATLGLIGVATTLIQFEQHLQAQEPLWDAIINATLSRFCQIMLTAAAAILGMLPLASNAFWGPMAIAIAGDFLLPLF